MLHPLGYRSVSEEEMSWLCVCRFAEVDTFAHFSHFISYGHSTKSPWKQRQHVTPNLRNRRASLFKWWTIKNGITINWDIILY